MHALSLGCLTILLLSFQQQTYPPIFPNQNPQPSVVHRLPIDEPEQAQPRAKQRPADAAKVQREADDLAKLAGGIPSAVEQANKGMVSKKLNERLKQIEKLSKRLRRDLNP